MLQKTIILQDCKVSRDITNLLSKCRFVINFPNPIHLGKETHTQDK